MASATGNEDKHLKPQWNIMLSPVTGMNLQQETQMLVYEKFSVFVPLK